MAPEHCLEVSPTQELIWCILLLGFRMASELNYPFFLVYFPKPQTRMDMLLPVAVGTAVVIGHMVLIPLDGCSINPARSFGSAVVSGEWADQWVFWVGPFVGGTVSILLWELLLRPPQEVSRADYNMRRASTLIAEGQRPAARLSRQVGRFVAPTF
eukprot:TRINITY_DN1298_c0_g1_i1.p1 TRINITY_DN1298_c0_g1~~TRINITY_DN1298_c0_g1_i1.p1  ORF type:complete len:177 (-),score=36.02 TRINITY_DN1298_c0_g1_i1:312-779(-)